MLERGVDQAVSVMRPKWLALGAVAVLLGLVLRVSWVSEDAYVTLRTVDNWVHGHGLRWNIDERVQAYVHPLWMMLLGAAYFITREVFVTTLLLGVLSSAAALLALVHFARTPGHALAAVVLLSLSRGFVDFSTSGLENPLAHLLLITFIGMYALRRALWQLALSAALLLLTRHDAIWLVGPALAHASWLELRARGPRHTARALLLGLSPWLAWEAFALLYYGFPFPNPAYARSNTGIPRAELVFQGFVYWLEALSWDPALHVVALAGVAIAFLQRRQRAIALGIVLYTLYVVDIGGDSMQGRSWTLPFVAGVCLLASSALPLEEPMRALALLLPFGFLLLHPLAREVQTSEQSFSGTADERVKERQGSSLVLETRTRPQPQQAAARLGRELAQKEEQVSVQEDAGLLGFAAGPRVHIIDVLARGDALLARLPMRIDPNWRAGHYVRQPPYGYLETVRDGTCRMRDKRLCAYYAPLHEVISGPLFSFTRLKAIVQLNLGQYDALIDRERYRNPKVSRAKLIELNEPIQEDAPWNASGALEMPQTGMTIDLPAPSHAQRMDVMFDSNDSYELSFFLGSKAVGKASSAALERGFMRTRSINLPAQATSEGFDHIVVHPVAGDQLYSIGYLRLQ